MKKLAIILLILLLSAGYYLFNNNVMKKNTNLNRDKNINTSNLKEAYFAGGCFWCIEGIMDGQKGVAEAISGYIGGESSKANYSDISSGKTKHRESVKVLFDPNIISYKKLVEIFLTQIDPTDEGGQFADRGYQYTTAIYYSNDEQKKIAENLIDLLGKSGKFDSPIATKIEALTTFYKAEEHHQNYAQKQTEHYEKYKKGSGRKGYIEENKSKYNTIYSKNSTNLKEKLSDLQYKVTQESFTEPPFNNKYWDNKKEGIYVDIVDGIPLFSSIDKFKSGTGWPSFTKTLKGALVEEKDDYGFFSKRTEIRTKNAHLGHLFSDGPKEKGGLRYCMNSASMDFIPKADLEKRGYGEYSVLFK